MSNAPNCSSKLEVPANLNFGASFNELGLDRQDTRHGTVLCDKDGITIKINQLSTLISWNKNIQERTKHTSKQRKNYMDS